MTERDAAPEAGGPAARPVRAATRSPRVGETRWPMAMAVLAAGGLRAVLPSQLRYHDARWLFILVVAALLAVLIIGDPGRIDRDSLPLRVATGVLIGLISAVNASAAIRLVAGIVAAESFSNNASVLLGSGGAIWLSNVICFGLWYWALDRGGAAARARGVQDRPPAFVFPEMVNDRWVTPGWYPKFTDYLYLSFTSATAFSPTDVSAIRPWAKLMMMTEEAISLVVALLVISRAVNILK